jgi:prevent-host-death family protein
MNISATELNKRPGTYLEEAIREPVVVEKSGRPSVVLVSYKHFMELEDFFWGQAAKEAEKHAEFLSVKESEAFLKSILAK